MYKNITSSGRLIMLLILFFSLPAFVAAQGKGSPGNSGDTTFTGIKFRSIGPALMSGRIADIAIHPLYPST
ncbi:MAG: hypothetical protein HGA37_14075, partial [Lentimicrobium sp.]|nr:hypothetical protein [Lentimicrobium sp.]